ncbi:hypothetical protein [Candidatus Vondammii sp. HM_W22]|uniref:hypothetical protein n=1 Tax=Candidatus Vondammii sp. HM_W22 TaxID=2687299 RepID=UPI001F1431F1|nr:hypothetical protein [Candidatus Vondammii sp. HM_W22]
MNRQLLAVTALLLATLAIEFGFYTIALKRPCFPDAWAKVKIGMSREEIAVVTGRDSTTTLADIKGFEFYRHNPTEKEIWQLELVYSEESERLNSITYRYIDDRGLFPGQGRLRNLSVQNLELKTQIFLCTYSRP